MGANAQTTVPDFVAETVLTAAKLDISAATGVPVFATTVTRDAAFGGANKVLAEGQTCYLESTNVVQYYDGAAWATVGPSAAAGLTLIKSQAALGGGSSITLSDVFSATYSSYEIVVDNAQTSAVDAWLALTLGAANTGYYLGGFTASYAGGAPGSLGNEANTSSFSAVFGIGNPATNVTGGKLTVHNPFATKRTTVNGAVTRLLTTGYAGHVGGYHDADTSFTAFTLTAVAGTITTATVSVYGYSK